MLLALDTSTRYAGLALHDGERVLLERTWLCGRHHSEQVLAEVAGALSLVGLELKSLDALAVARGPGSFSGVRVGIAIAKGFALGLGIPLYGVGTLDALAQGFAEVDLPVQACVEAGRGRWITARFQRTARGMVLLGEPTNVDLPGLVAACDGPLLVCGELDSGSRQRISEQCSETVRLASPAASLRRAAFVAERALDARRQGDPATVDAIYQAR